VVHGVFVSCTLDKRPERHQNSVFFGFARDEHGSMAKQMREVEISTRNAIEPVADSLT
jgi:hypothetical protein